MIGIGDEALADLSAAFDRQSKGESMQIDGGLRLVADGCFRGVEVFPHRDHHEGKEYAVEHADHGKFESGDLVVSLSRPTSKRARVVSMSPMA
jgi:hypothetical protein